MHDAKEIAKNARAFNLAMNRRGIVTSPGSHLTSLEFLRVRLTTELQELQQQRNSISKEIGKLKAKGLDPVKLIGMVSSTDEDRVRLERELSDVTGRMREFNSALPNLLNDCVPKKDYIRSSFMWTDKVPETPHWEIGESMNLIDRHAGAEVSGARANFLVGDLARLERALATFMMDVHLARGYTEIGAPVIVNEQSLHGTGQLPKFRDDVFAIGDGKYLSPTAEVQLTNMFRGKILKGNFPIKLVALTQCFRSEAGSPGRDTSGLMRQHQFAKVELVRITKPADGSAMATQDHNETLNDAERVLQQLELPYQIRHLAEDDTGFSSRSTFDIEVLMSDGYREISSVSDCGDFQARRIGIRFKTQSGAVGLCHTINGSGVAVGRCLAAVMENNYIRSENAISVPTVLRPYMGGQEVIKERKPKW